MNRPKDINTDTIQMAHGAGGRQMHRLIREVFESAFSGSLLDSRHDAAVLLHKGKKIAFTTDSYVIDPIFFPGGDIGCLSVYGTVNDLVMMGAKPAFLSAGFILEEGLPISDLSRIAESMRAAAQRSGVSIVTGDTKVVERGHGHGVFINTAGIGHINHDLSIGPESIQPGDAVIVNGDIGRHGLAVMACRAELALETTIESDCAPLVEPVLRLLDAGLDIHCMRDLTRGGLSSALVEISEAAHAEIALKQDAIPVLSEVAAACELLGLDPLYVANEGRFVLILPEEESAEALAILRETGADIEPVTVGEVKSLNRAMVTIRTDYGTERVIDMLSGDQLPRIC